MIPDQGGAGGPRAASLAPDSRTALALPLQVVPTVLALVAEAAWIAVVAALLEAFALHPPVIGFAWFVVAAAVGLGSARVLESRTADRWPVVVAALAVATGAVGWLLAPEVRATLLARGPAGVPEAVAANIGGWLGAVAVVRGVAHAQLPPDPRRVGNLLGIAIPGLAAVAIAGGMVSEPFRGAFLTEAQAEVLVFVLAAVLALALARLGLVATGAAVDWRRNPAWLVLLLGLLASTVALAVLVSVYAGPVIVVVFGAVAAPLLIVGFFAGFDRRSVTILLLSILGTAAVASLLRLFASSASTPPGPVPAAASPAQAGPAATAQVALGVLGIVLGIAVIAVLVLARLWLRRARDDEEAVPETREIDRGDRDGRPRHPSRRVRFGRRHAQDAVRAYCELLQDLEPHEAVRRNPAETPSEHAARLRATGRAGLQLDLLAADYGLARFGGVDLTPAEERRALRRARSLRRRLLRR